MNYSFFTQKEPLKAQKEITIFTLNSLVGIHAKMITGNSGIIKIASGKMNHEEKNSLKQSDIIIDSVPLDKSSLNKEIQSYQGLYIAIPNLPREQILYENKAIQNQVEIIRDALSEKNPDQRGYYYDNAGNYMQLLQDTLTALSSRIQKYHSLPFITVGGDFNTFIQTFKL